MEMICETLRTPVTAEYDVLVAGGGIAGAAAALSAARQGARTLLVERGFLLGGLATAGLITIYLPLCDGRGTQVSFGIAEELLRLAISMGAEADFPDAWLGDAAAGRAKQRFQVRYNAQQFALLLEELLCQNGVSVRYGATVAAMSVRDGRAEAAILESKSGREAIRARSFVDATGDADLFRLAGAKTEVFRQGNLLAAWYYRLAAGKLELCMQGAADVPDDLRGTLEAPAPIYARRFEGLNAEELSEMVTLSHAKVLEHLRAARAAGSDCVPVTLATLPQVRMTRRIVGAYTLDDDENGKVYPDEIGRIADWRRRGYVYGVPLRALYGAEVRNLIAAGRCISVTDAMWDVSRVIPACAVTGEAAGAAAALTDDFASLDARRLQNALLRAQGKRAGD